MPLRPPTAIAAGLLLLALAAMPARAGAFTDAAGRRVVLPAEPRHVMAASATAEVLVSVLAADKLAGASRAARRGVGAARRVPVLGWRPGMGPASMAETAWRLHPDLIIDAELVTPERAAFGDELFAWDPEIIIAEQRAFYDAMRRGPRRLAAVRNKRVYLAPSTPFGWIDDPPGVNRLIGLYWLSALFYPDNTQEDLRTTVCDFYDKFYGIKLTNGQLEALVRPAGVQAPTPGMPTEPLVGLGAAPPSSLPPTPRTPVTSAPSTVPGAPGTASSEPGAAVTPSAPSTVPGTAGTPSAASAALGAVPVAPKPAATASCSAPSGIQALTTPQAMPGMPETAPGAVTPGAPPPGRRGLAPSPSIPGATPR